MHSLDDLIVDFRTEPAGLGDVAERVAAEYARRKLRDAIAAEHATGGQDPARRRAGGRWRTRRWLIASMGAVVLVAAVLVVAAVLPNHGSGGGDVLLPPLAPPSASAAVVLNRVASVAARQPPSLFASPGQFAYSKVLSGSTTSLSSGSLRAKRCGPSVEFSYSFTEQDWVAPNGSGRQRITRGPNTIPPRYRAIAPQLRKDMNGVEPSLDSRYRPTMFPYSSPAGLPTNPRRLLVAIVRRFEHGKYALTTTFYRAEALLVASASPALRAALYRMLAQLPGVQFLGHQRDQIGRAGIAVGQTDSAGIRSEILFNPATSKLLAESHIQATRPRLPRCVPVIPVGTALDYSVYLQTGIVNSITATPGGGHVPFHPPVSPAGARPGIH